MVLHVLRGLFVLLMGAVGWSYLKLSWVSLAVALAVATLFVAIDVLTARRKLAVFSGVLFGLGVGILIAYGLSFPLKLVTEQVLELTPTYLADAFRKQGGLEFVTLSAAIVTCYLTISFTLQTKDDFRFIIPYVEFKKNTRGDRPYLLDTSTLIDGRIADVVDTGLIDARLVVPRFVLEELQAVADSGDRLKRNRGRRGLDVLARLRDSSRAEIVLHETTDGPPGSNRPTDQRLIDLATELSARLLTTDYNLNKVARVREVPVLNINDLAKALKPVVLPGERMSVKLVKQGESAGQGVGYLDDGTMVVVEQGRTRLNEQVDVTVTSALQTSAGRMIFGRLADDPDGSGSTARPGAGRDGR